VLWKGEIYYIFFHSFLVMSAVLAKLKMHSNCSSSKLETRIDCKNCHVAELVKGIWRRAAHDHKRCIMQWMWKST
jgi:hypothetical protein